MTQDKLQKTPFRIRLRGSGTFVAVAATGIITPKSVRAIRDSQQPHVRSCVEAYAQAYLSRRDWKWEIPDGAKR
jgi:hypothetical protein